MMAFRLLGTALVAAAAVVGGCEPGARSNGGANASPVGTAGAGTGGQASGGSTSGMSGSGGAAGDAPAAGGSSAVSGGAGGTAPAGGVAGASSGAGAGTSGSGDTGGEPGAGGQGPASGGSPSGGSATGGTEQGGAPAGGGGTEGDTDVFGITRLYPTAPGGAEWTSEHWSSGASYDISSRQDSADPSGLSGMRGTGTLAVNGTGELIMGGSQPRIYVYPPPNAPWKNVEVTVYYQRVEDAATAWAGLVVGARSGEEGHGDTPCDAHTYYSRLRHDGAVDFEKELMHSPSSTRSRVDPTAVWPPDGVLPSGVWIGWKYVVYNTAGDASVKLEAYRDLTEGADGGTWELVNEAEDAGGWFTQTSCDEHSPVDGESDLIWTQGGTTFIRNTDITEARYRWLTIREIAPP